MYINSPVTQRLEWESYKFLVVGSTPTWTTNLNIKQIEDLI